MCQHLFKLVLAPKKRICNAKLRNHILGALDEAPVNAKVTSAPLRAQVAVSVLLATEKPTTNRRARMIAIARSQKASCTSRENESAVEAEPKRLEQDAYGYMHNTKYTNG